MNTTGATVDKSCFTGYLGVNISFAIVKAPSRGEVSTFRLTAMNETNAAVDTTLDLFVGQRLNVTGQVLKYAGGNTFQPYTDGFNVTLYNDLTKREIANSLNLGGGVYTITGGLDANSQGWYYNGTQLQLVITTNYLRDIYNTSINITKINVTDRNYVLNLTFYIGDENSLSVIPFGTSTMTSYYFGLYNQTHPTDGGAFNISDSGNITVSTPTALAKAPSFAAVCPWWNDALVNQYQPQDTCVVSWNRTDSTDGVLTYTPNSVTFSFNKTMFAHSVKGEVLVNKSVFVVAYTGTTSNPHPVISSSTNATARAYIWAQMQPNYSFPIPLSYPNFTGGVFRGMTVVNDSYAPLQHQNDFWFNAPTQIEFLAYNLTFNVTFADDTSLQWVSIKAPLPVNKQIGTDSFYINQTLLPASWQAMENLMPGDLNSTSKSVVNVLTKNPGNFTIYVNYQNGSNFQVVGGMSSRQTPNAYFQRGVINLTLLGSTTNYANVSIIFGTQDETCINTSFGACGGYENCPNPTAYFNQYCQGNPMAPPRMESQPVFIYEQLVTGTFNPFQQDKSKAAGADISGTITYYANLTNILYNYTGSNIFVEFRMPKNITIWNGTASTFDKLDLANLSAQGNSIVNVTENVTMGWYNISAARYYHITNLNRNISGGGNTAALDVPWRTINETVGSYDIAEGLGYNNTRWTESPIAVFNESCRNIVDVVSGSPTANKNMTMCYYTFRFNLTQKYTTGNISNDVEGWEYGDSVVLNLTGAQIFKVLQNTSVVSGRDIPGWPGSSNQYCATIAIPSTGLIKFNNSNIPGIDQARTSDLVVTVNGVTYQNWTTGSLILSLQQSGVSTISVAYTVPSGTTTTTTGTTGSAGSTGAVTETKYTKTFTSITSWTPGTVLLTTIDAGVTEFSIAVKERVIAVKVTAEKLSERPTTITVDPATVYRWLGITTENLPDTSIDKITFKFQVEKTWLTTYGFSASDVRLYRYTDAGWVAYVPTMTSSDATYYYFEATTPGLSYFVIGAGAAGATPVPTPSVTPGVTPTPTATPTATPTTTPITLPQTTLIWIVIAVVLIVLVVVGWLLFKK